ncbi:MAG: branched-chain amino acid ABC transporter permease [Clostridiales Family XIII bacterium]|jgi:branched-chain amino acid transport system permease protein|nr:branched-chain amino acid ABC transporter permease [Clostridiales Family XIII bacterium]
MLSITAEVFGQLLINGLVMGLVYAILASGLVLIMSVTGIFYLCYGGFYLLGAYFVWKMVVGYGWPFGISLVVTMILMDIFGILTYILFFRLLQKRGEFTGYVVGAMGLFVAINQSSLLVFGTVPRRIPVVIPGTLEFSGISITYDKVLLAVLGIAITLILFYFYQKTKVGRAMRAVSFLPEAANLQGINSSSIFTITIGGSCALAAFAGGMVGPSFGVHPQMGENIIMIVIIITLLGGMDSLLGACVAGIMVGLIQSFGQFAVGGLVQVYLFLIIGIVIYFRPTGLFGSRTELSTR